MPGPKKWKGLDMKKELVLAFPREQLLGVIGEGGASDGVFFLHQDKMAELVPHMSVMPRHMVEPGAPMANQFAHIATYSLVAEVDEAGRYQKLFRYSRAKAGGEALLHGNTSIGVGGHANPWFESTGFTEEASAQFLLDSVAHSSRQELKEEIGLDVEFDRNTSFLFMYAPTNEVGEHHLAAISVVVVDGLSEMVGHEQAINHLEPWVPGEQDTRMEAWSAILADMIVSQNAAPAAELACSPRAHLVGFNQTPTAA